VFGSMHYSAVTKASARLETEMTHGKGLRNLVKEILSNVKTSDYLTGLHKKYLTKTFIMINSFKNYFSFEKMCVIYLLIPFLVKLVNVIGFRERTINRWLKLWCILTVLLIRTSQR
jgi:hypothetical protein